jgi:hypothetical protein
MTYGVRALIGTVVAGSLAAVVAYGIIDNAQLPLAANRAPATSASDRPRCPLQPPVLNVGKDWVRPTHKSLLADN